MRVREQTHERKPAWEYEAIVCSFCAEIVYISTMRNHECDRRLTALFAQHPMIQHYLGLCRVRGVRVKSPLFEQPLTDADARGIIDALSGALRTSRMDYATRNECSQ